MTPPPDYRQIAAQKARQYGVPVHVFLRQIKQESGFDPTAHSGAGADGIAQFIPSTAKAYGVNTRDPVSSLDGAARYDRDLIKQYGSVARALSAYNSGKPDSYKDPNFAHGQTYNYVRSILGGAGDVASSSPSPAAAASPSLSGALGAQPQVNPTAGLLQTLQGVQAPGPQRNDYGGFYAQLGAALKAKRQGAIGVGPPGLAGDAQASTFPQGGGGVPTAADLSKWVHLAANADRAGVGIQSDALNFVDQVAQVYGKPLTIGTGTNHNQYVAGSHRESDHWTGHAADIPASGATLTRLGQAALVAAGADPAWARKQKGGVFNIGGKQILFNTNEGGNHWNHLHVGVRTR